MTQTIEPDRKRFVRKAFGVSAIAGRTLPGRALLFLVFAYLFLWVPDLDLALMGILHHRSIVTHSLLPGLLFLVVGRSLGASPVAGALIGLSVHLTCDLLSPMIGYGQVWLPAPDKRPLGAVSYLWLGANAYLGFMVASLIARLAFRAMALPAIALTSATTGITYGWFNEAAILSVIVVLMMIGISLLPEYWWLKRARKKAAAV